MIVCTRFITALSLISIVGGPVFAMPFGCGSALRDASLQMFDSIRAKRIEGLIDASAAATAQVNNLVAHLRRQAAEHSLSKAGLVEEWRELATHLKSDPYALREVKSDDGTTIFVGRRDGKFEFLAFTYGEPPRVYSGVRSTDVWSDTQWRIGNERLTE